MYREVNQLYVILKGLILFIYFWPRCMWDPSSPTRDGTHTPCAGRAELSPLDHQGSPLKKPQFRVRCSWNRGLDATHSCTSYICVSLLLCSHQVVSDSLLPHLLQPASKSVRFPRQEHLSGLPCSSPGDLPNPGTEPESPALASRFFTTEPPRKPVQMLNTR